MANKYGLGRRGLLNTALVWLLIPEPSPSNSYAMRGSSQVPVRLCICLSYDMRRVTLPRPGEEDH